MKQRRDRYSEESLKISKIDYIFGSVTCLITQMKTSMASENAPGAGQQASSVATGIPSGRKASIFIKDVDGGLDAIGVVGVVGLEDVEGKVDAIGVVEAVGHEDVDGDLDATKVVGAVGPEDVGDGPDAIEVVGVSWGNMGEAA